MKNERRHELQNNVLAGWLAKQTQSGGKYTSWMLAGFIAVLLVTVFVMFSTSRQEASQKAAWTELYELQVQAQMALRQGAGAEFKLENAMQGLEGIAEENEGQNLAHLARFAIADMYLQQGGTSIRQSRLISSKAFEEAANAYTFIIEDKTASDFMVNLARFRRGRSFEWRNQLTDAIADYEATTGPYSTIAQNQLVALKNPALKQWYEEFDSLDLTPPAAEPSIQDLPDTPFSAPSDLNKYFNSDANNPLGDLPDLGTTAPAESSEGSPSDGQPEYEPPAAADTQEAEPTEAAPATEPADEPKTDDQ